MLLILVSRPTQSRRKLRSFLCFIRFLCVLNFIPCPGDQFLTAHFLYHALKSRGLPIRTIS